MAGATGWGEQAPETTSGLVDRVLGKPLTLQALLGAIAPLASGPARRPASEA